MNIEVNPVSACKVNIVVTADSSETKAEDRKELNRFIGNGRIKGFRQGKAPIDMVQKAFGAEIAKETESRLCRQMYKDALDRSGIKLVNLLDLKDIRFSPETGIGFSLVADVEPEFKLPKYKSIPVKPQDAAVTEAEVDEYIDRMRSAFAKFEEAPEGYEIRANDLVCIDFSGTIDGKPVKDVAPEAARISSGTDFWVQVDENQFVPEVIQALPGLKAGAEKSVKFKFPKTHPLEALQGGKAVYEVKVKAARKRLIPDDEELCRQVKMESLADFRKDVREKMLESARDNEMRRRRQAVTDYLLKKTSFDLPESELAEAVNNILDQMMREAQYRGMKPDDLASRRDEIVKSATQSATNQVRLKYIIREIAAKEEITASREEINAKIESMAKDFNMPAGEIRKRIADNKTEDVLSEQVVFDKTIDFLLDEAK